MNTILSNHSGLDERTTLLTDYTAKSSMIEKEFHAGIAALWLVDIFLGGCMDGILSSKI